MRAALLLSLALFSSFPPATANDGKTPPQGPCVAALSAEEAAAKAAKYYDVYGQATETAIRMGVLGDPGSAGMDPALRAQYEEHFIGQAREAVIEVLSRSFTALAPAARLTQLSAVRGDSSLVPRSMSASQRYVVAASFSPDATVHAVVDFDFMNRLNVAYFDLKGPADPVPAMDLAAMDVAAIEDNMRRAYARFRARVEQDVHRAIASSNGFAHLTVDDRQEYLSHYGRMAGQSGCVAMVEALKGQNLSTTVRALTVMRVTKHDFMSMSAMGRFTVAVALSTGVTKNYYIELGWAGSARVVALRPSRS